MVYNKLVGLRSGFGDSQATLAKHIGISKSNYYLKEKGRLSFSREDIKRISEKYNLSPTEAWDIFFAHEVNGNEINS